MFKTVLRQNKSESNVYNKVGGTLYLIFNEEQRQPLKNNKTCFKLDIHSHLKFQFWYLPVLKP